jgi:sialic acid synthase SpsE
MSELAEVEAAVATARRHGAGALGLLHCVSAYPVPVGSENLGAIKTLAERFDVPVGLSDHGVDPAAVPLAVALGASLYERHIMLEGDADAIDAAVSSTSADLSRAVSAAEHAQALIGHGRRECLPAEAPNRGPSRRGLYAARTLRAGARVHPDDVVCLRPVAAIGADEWERVVGCRLTRDVPAGAALVPGHLDLGGERI